MGNVAQAKGELLEALDEDGVAILNGDDPSVRGQARSFKGKIIYYGLDAANDLVASGIAIDLEGRPSFNVLHWRLACVLVLPFRQGQRHWQI